MSNEWNVNDDEAQVPLGVGGSSDAGEVPFEEKKPLVSSTTVLLAGVFIAGLVLIFVLGKQAGPRKASAEQQSKESQISASLAEMMSHAGKDGGGVKDTDALVKLFKDERAALKPEVQAASDPFAEPAGRKVATAVEPLTPVVSEDPAEQQRFRRIAETLAGLKVQSIMYSNRGGAAMINNKLAQVGTKFGDLVVSQIDPDRVIMSAGDKKFELRLARPKSD